MSCTLCSTILNFGSQIGLAVRDQLLAEPSTDRPRPWIVDDFAASALASVARQPDRRSDAFADIFLHFTTSRVSQRALSTHILMAEV